MFQMIIILALGSMSLDVDFIVYPHLVRHLSTLTRLHDTMFSSKSLYFT